MSIAIESFTKRFATVIARKSPGAVRQAAKYLYRLETKGESYPACLTILEAVFKAKLLELEHSTLPSDERRRLMAYAGEGYHLIRDELQYLRGRPRVKDSCFIWGDARDAIESTIDGSVRNARAAAGFYLYAGSRELAHGRMTVAAGTSAEAEMHALLLAMKTSLALGHRTLRVLTDAEALVSLFSRRTKLGYHPLGRELYRVLKDFRGFELRVVPRIYNHRADALALSGTRKA